LPINTTNKSAVALPIGATVVMPVRSAIACAKFAAYNAAFSSTDRGPLRKTIEVSNGTAFPTASGETIVDAFKTADQPAFSPAYRSTVSETIEGPLESTYKTAYPHTKLAAYAVSIWPTE